MGGLSRDAGGTSSPRRRLWRRPEEAGLALIDAVVASAILLIILVPTALLISTSGRIVTNSKAQAVAQSLAASQVGADRALFTSTSSPPTYTDSCASSATDSSDNVSLLGCPTVNGMKYWVYQNAGWCVTSSGSLAKVPSTTAAGTILYYWVEVVVAWGGSIAPTTTGPSNSVVLTSAIQTPPGYVGSTSAGCPL